MPTKVGNGGYSQEAYDPNTGKYTDKGNISNDEEKAMSMLGLTPKFNGLKSKNNLGQELSQGQEEYFKNSKMRDENGNLRVMFRGDPVEFDVFDRSKMRKSGQLGNGFYFSTENSHAGTYGNTKEYYLNIENPLSTTEKTLSYNDVLKLIKTLPELDEDFDIYNYGYGMTPEILAKNLVKEHNSDFSILRDLDITGYGNMSGLIELTNEILGTKYDGIITNIETVVFNPNQIKLVNNLNPTNSNSISDSQETQAMKLLNMEDY